MRKLAILLLKGYKTTFPRWKGKTCIHPVLLGVRHGGVCGVRLFCRHSAYGKEAFAVRALGQRRIRSSACKPQGKHEDVCVNAVSENQ